MARAQENPAEERSYVDHFGLTRSPFAPLPDPREIFDVEQYSLLSVHLDAAAEDTDHLVLVRGADGSGKTTLLNRYVGGLSDDSYFATIDESCRNETDFYCTFLQQLGFSDITGKPGELRHIANEFLVYRAKAGDPVLLIIDNVHHVRPSVLEQLRLIAATTIDGRRIMSTVITGNSHVGRIMESPAMQGLRFREFVDFHIRAYTEIETGAYVRHRLRLAGSAEDGIFAADSYAMIHRFSGGIPGQINKLCGALLADAVDRKEAAIDGEFVRGVAESRQLPPHVIPAQGKGRRKSDGDTGRVPVSNHEAVSIAARNVLAAAPADAAAQPSRRDSSRIDTNDLLARLARVSEQIDRLRSEKQQASQQISERDRAITELSEQLDEKSNEVSTLAKALQDSAEELQRLRNSLAESGEELSKSTETVRQLTADLKSESRTAKTAQKEFEKAEKKLEKLETMHCELQDTVADLKKELELSNEKAGHGVVLRRELEIAREKMGRIETLQGELEAARTECARLQSEAVTKIELEASLVEKDSEIEKLRAEIAAHDADQTANLSMRIERPQVAEQPTTETAPAPVPGNTIARFDLTRDGKLLRSIKRDEVPARCMIGRGQNCDVRLDSKYVSQHHALLIRTGSSVSIEDLKSSNGTKVNAERITRRELNPDDVINIGEFQIRVRRS